MKNINRVLIANRGEIARRVIRTCEKMGIETVTIFSDEDRGSLFTKESTISVSIGGRSSGESYLLMDKVLEVAKKYEVDAIHPGYGFLAENSEFATKCGESQIIFIGPNPDSITKMGLKNEAKDLAVNASVPTIPGYQGENQDIKTFSKEAKSMGFPVLLKASAGGGGKGMVVANSESEVKHAFEKAKREALASFGNDHLILERYFPNSKHIEVQVFGDSKGNVVHLYERECSMQRRHQKIIEEAPSPSISDDTRNKMTSAAISLAKSVNYIGAGTVEFIYDVESNDFFFLEMNTRLQVEHPVTEEILKLDLVEWQINVAKGLELPLVQDQIKMNGHAIESRIYAEDPNKDFMPQSGNVYCFKTRENDLRIESALDEVDIISSQYDPMVAKIVTLGRDREESRLKMISSLNKLEYWGPTNNINYLTQLLKDNSFIDSSFNTKTAENISNKTLEFNKAWAIAYAFYKNKVIRSNSGLPANLSVFPEKKRLFSFDYNDKNLGFELKSQGANRFLLNGELAMLTNWGKGQNISFEFQNRSYQYLIEVKGVQGEGELVFLHSKEEGSVNFEFTAPFPDGSIEREEGDYIAPMPGKIVQVLVKAGKKVGLGEKLVILEAMKMENEICAQNAGVIESVLITQGQQVESGQLLIQLREK